MYTFDYFTETDIRKIEEIIHTYPFAMLIGTAENGYPVATQIPLELISRENKSFLRGHIMKGTDHHLAFEKNAKVMAVFTGPQHYISASWYVKKNVGSTWNYVTIQASGILQFKDEGETRKILEEITNKYEDAESEAAFGKLSEKYIREMLKYVAGFEIQIEKLENVFKLSQNHSSETRTNIIQALEHLDTDHAKALAALMKVRQ